MLRRFSPNFTLFSMALDGIIIFLGLIAASYLRPHLGFFTFARDYPEVILLPWIIPPTFAIEWVAVNTLFSVYDGRRSLSWVNEFTALTLGALLSAMAMAGTLYLTFREVSRLLFACFVIISYLSMLIWRTIARAQIVKAYLPTSQARRVMILSGCQAGNELRDQIDANPQAGLRVVEFLDDRAGAPWADLNNQLEYLENKIRELKPDDVILALPQDDYQRTNAIVSSLHRYPIKIWLVPDYFRLALHKAVVEEFAGILLLDLRAPALTYSQRLIKRAFDLLITLIIAPFALAAGAMIAIAVRLDTPGPIIFSQQRMGENGRFFRIYKFRSMHHVPDPPPNSNMKVDPPRSTPGKRADDPRVTRVGKFLRRSSLDEIPQLFNVLRGDMSLVGPRPEVPSLVDRYEPWQRQRFTVPQGMTGWWQINGRSDRPMHLHTEDDIYYVQHYSLFLDIYILLRTLVIVIQGRGAY